MMVITEYFTVKSTGIFFFFLKRFKRDSERKKER